MKEKTFDSIIDLGCHMYDVAESGKTITAVVFEEVAEELWRWLSDYDETKTGVIFIHGDYNKEYYVTFTNEFVFSIVPVFMDEGKMLSAETDIMLFDGDVSNKIALGNNCEQYEIVYEDDDDDIYSVLLDDEFDGLYDFDEDDEIYDFFEEDDEDCGECCGDCSNCERGLAVEAIGAALNYFSYILNQYDNVDD